MYDLEICTYICSPYQVGLKNVCNVKILSKEKSAGSIFPVLALSMNKMVPKSYKCLISVLFSFPWQSERISLFGNM